MNSTTVSLHQRQPKIDEGVYDATITAVVAEDGIQTQYGMRDRIIVTFDVNGVEVTRRYNKSLFPSSALYGLISELVSADVPDEFDVAALVDMPCHVIIAHRATDAGDVWENIERVMKPTRQSALT
jgi:hypothetical protein